MCVPAHDDRDAVFAGTHGLPTIPVLRGPAGEDGAAGAAYTGAGLMLEPRAGWEGPECVQGRHDSHDCHDCRDCRDCHDYNAACTNASPL